MFPLLVRMKMKPLSALTAEDSRNGMALSVRDGLATEAMTTFTGGSFLVAIAIYSGAGSFQIGLLASLPAMTNIFQLLAIWLVQRYRNRRAIAVISSTLARLPLLVIGLLPFLFSSGTSINTLIFLLLFHYFFGSLAGPGWNSWMKDLVPAGELGSFFAHRGRMIQILNVTLSLFMALVIDHVKAAYPEKEVLLYSLMFIVGGIAGLLGVYFISRTPEPQVIISGESVLKMVQRPFLNVNFRRLLAFQAAWSFALNIATPFYSVYILKSIGLPLRYLVALNLLTQLSSIASIRIWGRYSDWFSNKTILHVCAPLYACCIVLWPIVSFNSSMGFVLSALVFIHILTGLSSAGVNLALGNIGLKLAPREEAISYIVARSMTLAAFAALAPLTGGILAELFTHFSGSVPMELKGTSGHSPFRDPWNYLFLCGGILALSSLQLLKRVGEDGEIDSAIMVARIRKRVAVMFVRLVR